MKILYVTPYYKPAWFYGGPPKCIAEQAEFLASRYGYQIDVITLNKNGSTRLFDSDVPVIKKVNGVKVHYLPESKGILGRKYFQAEGLSTYMEQFKNVDLIHVNMLFNAFSVAGFRLGLKYKIPYIVSLHGMLDAFSLTRNKWMKKIHSFFFEDHFLQKARAVHFTTENEFKNAIINKPIHPVVIPLGFFFEGPNDHSFHFPSHPETLKLVFLGRINRKKGLDLLINGIGKLPKHIKENILLDIWGEEDEPCKPELIAQISDLDLTLQIHFKGNLSPDIRNETLKKYDVLTLTSHQENFGLVVVEALEQKIPVLISDKVNLSDFVLNKKCGLVCELNEDSIANQLEHIFNLTLEIRAEIGLNGYHAVRKLFNMKVVGQLYQELYELCVRK